MNDSKNNLVIGGQPAVTLTTPTTAQQDHPHFLSADILPGKGMNLWQIKAYVPGLGETDLIHSIPLPKAKELLDSKSNVFGNDSFKEGGAILLPFANRIRGELSKDESTITTEIAGKSVQLPANWQGIQPGAPKHAIHGLLLDASFQDLQIQHDAHSSSLNGRFHAGDFHGHWLSQTEVEVHFKLSENRLQWTVTAANVGQQPLPMGIGWHPYFVLPSGNRHQARLHLPAAKRVVVNNYDDVFPTGQFSKVNGTEYDFNPKNGVALQDKYLDDCFTDLHRNSDGAVAVEISDPAAHYGLRILALSPHIQAIQVYAPPDKSFIAIEPQFNLADPFMKAWGNTDSGMVTLSPGQRVEWQVVLELFEPTI